MSWRNQNYVQVLGHFKCSTAFIATELFWEFTCTSFMQRNLQQEKNNSNKTSVLLSVCYQQIVRQELCFQICSLGRSPWSPVFILIRFLVLLCFCWLHTWQKRLNLIAWGIWILQINFFLHFRHFSWCCFSLVSLE